MISKKIFLLALITITNRSTAQNFHLELVDIITDSGMHSVSQGNPWDAIFKIDGNLLYVLDAGYDQKGKEICLECEYSKVRLLVYDLNLKSLLIAKFIDFNSPIWLPVDMAILEDDIYLLTSRFLIGIKKSELLNNVRVEEEFRIPLSSQKWLGSFCRLEIIDDSTLCVLDDLGENFKMDPKISSGFSFFNTRTKSFFVFIPVDIPGLSFSHYARHTFMCTVSEGRIIVHNGYDYTLSLLNEQGDMLTTLNSRKNDTSWYTIDSTAFADYRNKLGDDYGDMFRLVEKKDHVERIFKTSPLSDSFYVLTTRHSVISSERNYSVDLWNVNESNQFVLLAKDFMAYPIRSKSIVNNRSHFYHWSGQFLMSPDYLIMYKNDVYSPEIKRMLTSTKPIKARKFKRELKKLKKTKQPEPCMYVYKIVKD